MSHEALRELGVASIKSLESELGILASARGEAYGCVFGRDSLIASLALLRAYNKSGDEYLLTLVGRSLATLARLQGHFDVIESGEEPGKIIHEYRPSGHEHLTQVLSEPWYVYPSGEMRNYDTVDATPLFLIAVDEYVKAGGKNKELLSAANAALWWLVQNLERGHGFLRYSFNSKRTHGGLRVQSWMDSTESLFYETSDDRPPYPVAPVEAQAYAWSALMRWGQVERADELKKKFNEKFVLRGPKSVTLAFALDGNNKKLTAPRSSMGHVLWAAYEAESILDKKYVDGLRKRLLARDLFVPKAGIRTLSSRSLHFNPQSYHNGSIWPHDTAMLAEGLENFGYANDAKRVRSALINAYTHFKTPLELYAFNRKLLPYKTVEGHQACQVQAWSAASLLSILE